MRRPSESEQERETRPADLKARVSQVQETVRKLEAEVAAGTIPTEGMEDFKRAIDEARMRIWAVLTAANDADPAAFLERFRVRRAIEICRAIERDLADGTMHGDYAELQELGDVLKGLSGTIGRFRA